MKNKPKSGQGMAIGIAIGVAIGVALDNIGAWLAIGVALGAGMEQKLQKSRQEEME